MSQQNQQLSRVAIEGYKSIKKCDIELRNLNVFIGSNGAGKSNFISALSWYSRILNHEMNLFAAEKGAGSLFSYGTNKTDSICMEFWFGESSHYFDIKMNEVDGLFFNYERFGNYPGKNYSGHTESKWNTPTLITDAFGSAYDALKTFSLRSFHFSDSGFIIKPRNYNISNNDALRQDASNLAAYLYRLRQCFPIEYREITTLTQRIAPFFEAFELEPNRNNNEHIVLRWRQKGCEDIFNASQLSDGTLRFICLATLLLQPSDLQPATIVIDEPEIGLHPYAITMLAEMIKKAAFDKQIIIATQSVELLDHFAVDDIVVVDRIEGATVFSRLAEEQLSSWLDEYSLGELWNKNILGGRVSR